MLNHGLPRVPLPQFAQPKGESGTSPPHEAQNRRFAGTPARFTLGYDCSALRARGVPADDWLTRTCFCMPDTATQESL